MEKKLSYKVESIRVIDGDTIECDIICDKNNIRWGIHSEGNYILKKRKIRLSGINAPEIFGKEKLQGYVSKRFLMNILDNEDVYIEVGSVKFEKYGRILAIVWIIDDKMEMININDLMITNKMAVPALVVRGKYVSIK